jgi:hypothetical protein
MQATISSVAAAVRSAITAATPGDEHTRIVVTPRGAALVAIFRTGRILPEIPAAERAVALASLQADHLDELDLDDEDRAYLAPYLADLAATCV